VEKLKESTCKAISVADPNLEIRVKQNHLKYSRAILRHQTTFVLVQTLLCKNILYSTHGYLSNNADCSSIEVCMRKFASRKLTYHIDDHGMSG
jgi:hypothetical protein